MSEKSNRDHRLSASRASTQSLPKPARPHSRQLPIWKVLLHNDDVNNMNYVVNTIMMLTPLGQDQAACRMQEAHQKGVSLLLSTHRERAELYAAQFASRNLSVTIEAQ